MCGDITNGCSADIIAGWHREAKGLVVFPQLHIS